MKTIICALLAVMACNSAFCNGPPGNQNPGELSATEEATLVFMREEEKLARDVYLSLGAVWNEPIFENIAVSEQRHMETLLSKLDLFGVEDPVPSDAIGVFANQQLATWFDQLVSEGLGSALAAYQAGATIEETDIRDLGLAIEETDKPTLINAYENLQAASRNHLRAFVGHIEAAGVDYQAQVLDQDEVDLIVGNYSPPPSGFTIHAGLNDAWFDPASDGQGFFITVLPDCKTVFLGWFTFETERPDESVVATLGDPGHRWLTAVGEFNGSQADLTLYNTVGGVFATYTPEVSNDLYGALLLEFEDCNSGQVTYDIPTLGLSGIIPIQRVAVDNVDPCNSRAPVIEELSE
jgi:hypothetical protein